MFYVEHCGKGAEIAGISQRCSMWKTAAKESRLPETEECSTWNIPAGAELRGILCATWNTAGIGSFWGWFRFETTSKNEPGKRIFSGGFPLIGGFGA